MSAIDLLFASERFAIQMIQLCCLQLQWPTSSNARRSIRLAARLLGLYRTSLEALSMVVNSILPNLLLLLYNTTNKELIGEV